MICILRVSINKNQEATNLEENMRLFCGSGLYWRSGAQRQNLLRRVKSVPLEWWVRRWFCSNRHCQMRCHLQRYCCDWHYALNAHENVAGSFDLSCANPNDEDNWNQMFEEHRGSQPSSTCPYLPVGFCTSQLFYVSAKKYYPPK